MHNKRKDGKKIIATNVKMLNNIDLEKSSSINFYFVLYSAGVLVFIKINEKNPETPITTWAKTRPAYFTKETIQIISKHWKSICLVSWSKFTHNNEIEVVLIKYRKMFSREYPALGSMVSWESQYYWEYPLFQPFRKVTGIWVKSFEDADIFRARNSTDVFVRKFIIVKKGRLSKCSTLRNCKVRNSIFDMRCEQQWYSCVVFKDMENVYDNILKQNPKWYQVIKAMCTKTKAW